MKNDQLPILIFAQSGRLLAQSASQAGYTTWLADCFLDVDSLAVADRTARLPAIDTLNVSVALETLNLLSQGQNCLLIYGSGIEHIPELLIQLPKNISLIANPFECIQTLNTPRLFFPLLAKLNLLFPTTLFSNPADNRSVYLYKPNKSLGGKGIKLLSDVVNANYGYIQQKINGISGSTLFIANGLNAKMISINNLLSTNEQKNPYLIFGIESPLTLSPSNLNSLDNIISVLTKNLTLRGINSLDFIVDEHDKLYILELNPRPSASMALIDPNINLFQLHILSCMGELPTTEFLSQNYKGLYYFYAPYDLRIPHNMEWPTECVDLPREHIFIAKNQVVCSILVNATQLHACRQASIKIKNHLLNKLTPET